VWLHGEVKTPPFSSSARIEAGVLLPPTPDAIVVAAVFAKKTQHTPQDVIVQSRRRLGRYDAVTGKGDSD
jgi:hypothetical protein